MKATLFPSEQLGKAFDHYDMARDGIAALRGTGRLLGGVASIESAAGEIVRVEALSSADVGGPAEERLTEFAKSLIPALPFAEIDVLIIDRAGKVVYHDKGQTEKQAETVLNFLKSKKSS